MIMEYFRRHIVLRPKLGMSLMELLGVMLIMIILAGIAVGGVMQATERSRVTKAYKVLTGYEEAFLTAAMDHPSLIGDRKAAWGADGSAYSSQTGLKRAAVFINEHTDDSLHFYWDSTYRYYRAEGPDPWGGSYILTEYPNSATDPSQDYYQCNVFPGSAYFTCAIWATGNSDALTSTSGEQILTKNCYGVCITFYDGIVTPIYHGFNKSTPYVGWKLICK